MNIIQLGPQTFALDSAHEIFYDTGTLPTPQDVIDSLTGIPRIFLRVPDVLKALDFSGPLNMEIYVSRIESGSQRDSIIIRSIFGSEENANKWIDLIRRKTGIEYMNDKHPIITPLFSGLIGIGIFVAATRMLGREGSGDGNIQHLREVSNSFINTGAITLQVSPEDFRSALQTGGGNMLNLASNATRAVAPVKRALASAPMIKIDDNPDFIIDSESIKATPTHVDRTVEEPTMQIMNNEEVSIRALDIDNLNKGWFIIVPRLTEKRLPLEVANSIDFSSLQAGRTIKADIEIFYTIKEDGDRIYKRAFLRNIHK